MPSSKTNLKGEVCDPIITYFFDKADFCETYQDNYANWNTLLYSIPAFVSCLCLCLLGFTFYTIKS